MGSAREATLRWRKVGAQSQETKILDTRSFSALGCLVAVNTPHLYPTFPAMVYLESLAWSRLAPTGRPAAGAVHSLSHPQIWRDRAPRVHIHREQNRGGLSSNVIIGQEYTSAAPPGQGTFAPSGLPLGWGQGRREEGGSLQASNQEATDQEATLIHLQAPKQCSHPAFSGLWPCKPGPIQIHRNAPQANGH